MLQSVYTLDSDFAASKTDFFSANETHQLITFKIRLSCTYLSPRLRFLLYIYKFRGLSFIILVTLLYFQPSHPKVILFPSNENEKQTNSEIQFDESASGKERQKNR